MADIFQGTAPTNVNTNTTATTSINPAFTTYQDYLNNLSSAGNAALATPSNKLVAPLTQLQNDVYGTPQGQANTESDLYGAISPLASAATTAGTAANGVGASQINAFMNPYISGVNNQLSNLSAQNVNQSVLPALQAMGASTGQTGSQRQLNATGQALGGIQQGLNSQLSTNLASGYQNAVNSALQEQQNLGSIANIQGNIGAQGETATANALNTASALGAQGQAQNQAIINAPLTQASNAAALLKGYAVPTTSNTQYTGPASVYGPSIASQLLGAGTGAASLLGGTGASLSDLLKKGATGIGNLFSSNPATPVDPSGLGSPVVGSGSGGGAGTGQILGTDGKVYNDPTYGTVTMPGLTSSTIELKPGFIDIGNNQQYNPTTNETFAIDSSKEGGV